jgi:uncharacterized protein
MRAFASALVVSLWLVRAGAAGAESLPPPPTAYFNDYASLVSAADAARLEDKLRRFADETSTQVVVVVFESLPSESLEDFTIRAAQAWGAGRKDWDNGAVLFVFVSDRKMRIETGYGLEGALPDQLAARILDLEVRPRFRAGDWAGGLEAGIDGILAATRGEYKAPPPKKAQPVSLVAILIILFFVVLLVWLGTHQVIRGELTIGQLISFLGYALFMIYPIQTFFEFAQKLLRGQTSEERLVSSSFAKLVD